MVNTDLIASSKYRIVHLLRCNVSDVLLIAIIWATSTREIKWKETRREMKYTNQALPYRKRTHKLYMLTPVEHTLTCKQRERETNHLLGVCVGLNTTLSRVFGRLIPQACYLR